MRVAAPFERLTGTSQESRYALSRWLFLRALGIVYLIAFVSLWVQVEGLIGPDGILPAGTFLASVARRFGSDAVLLVPSVLWLGTSDTALHVVSALGVAASLLLVLDVAPVLACLVAWVLYLSLQAVGGDFLAFQWDVLLLETGLLAVLLAPRHLFPSRPPTAGPNAIAIVLLWFLLFRLTFESGAVKLTSGDPTWRNLTALDYHFFTQPLPTWTAWYAHHLPDWLKHVAVVSTYALELVIPPLIFLGRRPRRIAFAGIVLLQLLIFGSGNYTFFNLLTVALALLLLDDADWRRLLPRRLVHQATRGGEETPPRRAPSPVSALIGLPLLLMGVVSLYGTLAAGGAVPRPFQPLFRMLEPFQIVNSYGLFRVMTTKRHEIVVEGSADGVTWKPYEFRDKPGDPMRRPAFVEPHQPRLDWQMWFAALGRFETTPWFQAFLARLLQGSPDVAALLATNPFPNGPPRYLRAQLYDYRFTSPEERRLSGAWWHRELLGSYGPVVSLSPQ